jgi:hypothetical protein
LVWYVVDWNEVHAAGFRTVNREKVNLACVRTAAVRWLTVVAIRAASRKPDCAEPQAACLALNASELFAIVDDQVVARVLPERFGNDKAHRAQYQHDRECGLVADVLRVFHRRQYRQRIGWAMADNGTANAATILISPE